jgi:hypothetical protein
MTDGQLNLRFETDRAAMREVLTGLGILLAPEVLEFAASKLSDDWLLAWASSQFNVRTTRSHKFGIGLGEWAELAQSIFDLKSISGIDEQIRRLCTPSHEALDTCLVLQIAGRYKREGYSIRFEPNGKGCSDLLIQNDSFRSYVEVKRENDGHELDKGECGATSAQPHHLRCRLPSSRNAAGNPRQRPRVERAIEDALRVLLDGEKPHSLFQLVMIGAVQQIGEGFLPRELRGEHQRHSGA